MTKRAALYARFSSDMQSVVGRYDSTAGLENLMKQYKQIKIAVKVPPAPY